MKPTVLLTVLVAIFSFVTSADARIVVYKGTVRATQGDATSATSNTRTLFYIVDFDTLQGTMVFAQGAGPNRTIFDNGIRSYGISQIATKPVSTIYLTAGSGNFSSQTNFSFFHSRFGGKRAQLALESGVNGFVGSFPRALNGVLSDTFGTPFAFIGTSSLTFQMARTQTANAAFKSVAQASFDVRAEFVARGYTDTTAF